MLLGEKLEGGRRRDPSNGLIMPWYTSPCLEWLTTLDFEGMVIWEYGVGDSTIWYREKGAQVTGVDSNSEWAKKANCPHYVSKAGYVLAIENEDRVFDIVVIDGDYRDECTGPALHHLKSGGYLIIDNYKQPSVKEHWPLTEKLIEGMPITIYKEPGHYDWQTAVITKP